MKTFEWLLPDMEVLWRVLNTIDVEAAKRRGIAVCNLPGKDTRAVAEMTLALMLACLRRLPDLDSAVRTEGGWRQAWELQESFGELGGRTVGLIGFGAVPSPSIPFSKPWVRACCSGRAARSNATFEDLLARSDIVSLYLPLTPQTEQILDARKMKRGAILVNTARGGLVDEQALLERSRAATCPPPGWTCSPRSPRHRITRCCG